MVVHVFISGFVQGVGFRQFVKRTAKNFGFKGWVRNLPDGRVEALFSGEKEKIEKTVEALWKGPFLSEVKNIVVEKEEGSEEFKDFEIIKE
ncbi:MAG: hypothetical protein A2958_01485 [Candidatus Levybacteria bacterium RIFCSPLOWO2_01_FULL_38_13]|nr:MAG: hypothetical protein A2629_01585 [Candidatus Levybacteria bacterium RIFCSPHIGHO2_01_FULL_41_15]OGH34621.1 MAG: hypothetical protein A2958_01485 [Candidatus Levybacteria bacterium RIFCSPLOWO2_01_FULL_38_13]